MMSENFRDFFFFHQIGKLCTSTNQEEQLVLRGVPKREDVLKEWKELNSCLSLSFIAKILKKMRFYLEKGREIFSYPEKQNQRISFLLLLQKKIVVIFSVKMEERRERRKL